MKIKIFCCIKETGKILNKIMNQLYTLIFLFLSKDIEEITFLYKSQHNYN